MNGHFERGPSAVSILYMMGLAVFLRHDFSDSTAEPAIETPEPRPERGFPRGRISRIQRTIQKKGRPLSLKEMATEFHRRHDIVQAWIDLALKEGGIRTSYNDRRCVRYDLPRGYVAPVDPMDKKLSKLSDFMREQKRGVCAKDVSERFRVCGRTAQRWLRAGQRQGIFKAVGYGGGYSFLFGLVEDI